MALFINQGILVTASQNGQKGYSYNTVTAVLLTEIVKLFVSSGLFVHRKSLGVFVNEVSKNSKVFLLYFIPAFLYCLYNNLAYTNLATFDPTTYFLLLQFRVVVTGIVFQILFKKKLSTHQWISLLFLTLGCMVKEINFDAIFGSKASGDSPTSETSAKPSAFEFVGLFLIFLQVVCSSSAGVYNEYLLKDTGAHVPVLVQNTCLYLDSIICNVVLLIIQGNLGSGLNMEAVKTILGTPIILAVILNNAAIGIVTSFFLAQLNSILKTFASALELMFTAVLCWMIFGIPIYLNTLLAICIVTLAIYLYSLQPVVNRGRADESPVKSSAADSQKLLEQDV
jgi:integrin beta 8